MICLMYKSWIPLAIGIFIAGGAYTARAVSNRLTNPSFSFWGRISYPGNFKEKMNTSEAALIMGLRASSEKSKIEERYRKLMMMNHPDQGGSPYIAGKVNEAKTLLMKGKE